MPTPSISYQFDPTGLLQANRITGEQHAVTEANFRNYFFIVPLFAPFFADNITITHTHQGLTKTLDLDVDYYCSLPFLSATRSIGKNVYGAIALNNLNTVGIITLNYNTLGGNWCANQQLVLERFAEHSYNPRITTWEQIVNLPTAFPVINHEWDIRTLIGHTELIDAIYAIRDAIALQAQTEWTNHIHDYNNPHRVTKAQLGLENIGNWARATVQEVLAGISADTLVVPATLKYALDLYFTRTQINALLHDMDLLIQENDQQIAQTVVQLLSHISDYNDPHRTTKAQVELGLVENLAVVTPAEIDANVPIDPDKYLTFNMFLRYMGRFGNGVVAPDVQLIDCAGNVLGYMYPVGNHDPAAIVPFSYADNIIMGYVCSTATVHCTTQLFNCEGTLLGYIKADAAKAIVTYPDSALSFVNRLSVTPTEVTRLKGILGI